MESSKNLFYEYTKEYTIFRIYSPISKKVQVILENRKIDMENIGNGIFEIKVNGDCENKRYVFWLYQNNVKIETLSPYAKACIANGIKSVVLDLNKTNPENFLRMPEFNPLDAIIYELHIRDFTVKAKKKGKFLGLIEENELNYLKNLGITHVQILPFFDFSKDSVDELNPNVKYNWGYDPENYNIPEGAYSTEPNDPLSRIKELKYMIKVLHDNNIRVIMDVVYNHVYDRVNHCFFKTMGQEAFRMDEFGYSNGSGCGNDIASEKEMMRKFIVDSVKYWAKEYNIDGFRFDLMGLLDIETMKKIRKELDKIDKSIIILGEGWDLNTPLDPKLKANQNNAKYLNKIAFFNDDIRDGLRGSTYEKLGKGFINSNLIEDRLLKSIKGGKGLKTYKSPAQLIQYVEAHDNHTLFDHLEITNKEMSLEDRLRIQTIATSIILTSQGIPFLHAGQEFFRTKLGEGNSFKSSDRINKMDFDRAKEYKNYVEYIKNLIEYRKNQKLFKMETYKKIEEKFNLIEYSENLLAYNLDEKIYILVNTSDTLKEIKEIKGNYIIKFSEFKKLDENIKLENGIKISKYNFMILEKID